MGKNLSKCEEEVDKVASLEQSTINEGVSNRAEVDERSYEKSTSEKTENPIPLRRPLNCDYAGETFHFDSQKNEALFAEQPKLREQLERQIEKQNETYYRLSTECPEGVRFDKDGYPDFSPYKYEALEAGQKNEVLIEITGNRVEDAKRANEVAGFKETPDKYTWHHHQDGYTIQLVRNDVHEAVRHTGGVSTKSDIEIKKFVFDLLTNM